MKIAVINDTHFGVKGDNEAYYSYFDKFYKDVFFPTIDERDIRHVFHLGDLYDRRRYVNFKTAKETERIFLDPLHERMLRGTIEEVTVLTGNHDLYYRNVNEINSLDILLGKYPFRVLTDPYLQEYDGVEILFLPWICESNNKKSLDAIKRGGTIAMGHLELNGYEMYKGIIQSHGMDDALFSGWEQVYSGHYHHKSSRGNITYLGAPCEYTWSDFNDPRGFHIFDTETKTMEFIRNPHVMHNVLTYDDKDEVYTNYSGIENTYVKVLALNKSNPFRFDKYMDGVYASKPLDITVIEDNLLVLEAPEDETNTEDMRETVDIIRDSIDTMTTQLDKDRLKKEMVGLYNEAIALGTNDL